VVFVENEHEEMVDDDATDDSIGNGNSKVAQRGNNGDDEHDDAVGGTRMTTGCCCCCCCCCASALVDGAADAADNTHLPLTLVVVYRYHSSLFASGYNSGDVCIHFHFAAVHFPTNTIHPIIRSGCHCHGPYGDGVRVKFFKFK
jgi:hypothetical protein